MPPSSVMTVNPPLESGQACDQASPPRKGRGPWGRGTRRVRAGCTAHESSAPGPRGDDSFTVPEPTATRSGRTGTAAHAASLILNKCFKGHTPGARNVSTRARRRGGNGTFRPLPECPRGRQGSAEHVRPRGRRPPSSPRSPPARGQHPQGARRAHRWVPAARPPAPPRHSRKAGAPSPTRRPLAPFLSVTSYIITRANRNGSGARGRGPVPGRRWVPAPRAPGPRARRRSARLRGEGQSAASARPSSQKALPLPGPRQEAASVTNCVSFFKHVSRAPPAGEPPLGQPGRGPGWLEPPRGGESCSGPGRAAPPGPRRAARPDGRLGNLGPPGRAAAPPPGRPGPPALGRLRPRPAGRGDAGNFPGPRRAGRPPGSRRIALTSLSGGHEPGGPRGARGALSPPPARPPRAAAAQLPERPARPGPRRRPGLEGTSRGRGRAWGPHVRPGLAGAHL
ncbi:collagen alpha-1(I) chain-like [Ovis aries]|uniref:collagen alpha-1(I) chain-like n=1 Tax=Ovis aries TaxID=9940 RepID=UPI001C2E60B1|nr:collagen alpha-1(I) chain-like [Ovis aries]